MIATSGVPPVEQNSAYRLARVIFFCFVRLTEFGPAVVTQVRRRFFPSPASDSRMGAELLAGSGADKWAPKMFRCQRVCATLLAVRELHFQGDVWSNLLAAFRSDSREIDRQ
jgi:hypothetical protein